MSLNQRLALRIMIDLEKAKSARISLNELNAAIAYNLKALDPSFPKDIIASIKDVASKIHEFDDPGIQDGSIDHTISALKNFVVTRL